MEELIPRFGGYRRLHSFQVAQLVYDVTVRFCDRYVGRRSRTHDQMVQAARSGVQNIAEGSLASATSKKTELKLTNVARASLGELMHDYEDFLRQRRLPLWACTDPRRKALVAQRCSTADEVALWVREVATAAKSIQSMESIQSIQSTPGTRYAECSANAGHVLTGVAFCLLDRQLKALARTFEREGGFSERMYRIRTEQRSTERPRSW
ncbi:MAG TPA: four helix bundle suffix domain-containing protein [Myxococcales bacterium]|jgi:four helix bundle suffix protein